MNKKTWAVIGSLVVIGILAVAAYQAMAGIGQGPGSATDRPRIENTAPAPTRSAPSTATQPPAPTPDAETPSAPEPTLPRPTPTLPLPTRAPIILPGWNGRPGIILATQQPAREPDLQDSAVVEVRDQSIFVKPLTKGGDGQALPQTEVISVNTTEVYRDETNFDQLTAEGFLQRVLVPYTVEQIDPGDILYIWGYTRGDRLVADLIIVYVCRTETGEEC